MMQVLQRMQWRAHSWAPCALTHLPLVRRSSTHCGTSTERHCRLEESRRGALPRTCQRDRGCECPCGAL